MQLYWRILIDLDNVRTPNFRRRSFIEKLETIKNLMANGEYLKDIHASIFAANEISYSQFARYVQRYIKSEIAPAVATQSPQKTPPSKPLAFPARSPISSTPKEVKDLFPHKSSLENPEDIY